VSPNPTIPPWSPSLERQALGEALLSQPPPSWLTADHFFGGWHPTVFRAVLALSKRSTADMLPRVAKLLRSKGLLYRGGQGYDRHGSQLLSAVDLAEMVAEAEFARRMGWALPWDELRDLADQRRLLAATDRAGVLLRAGRVGEARQALKGAI
jgi:hypothetical protein